MLNIRIISVGKIKEKYFENAIKEYAKRLSRYCKLEMLEVKDEPTPEGAGIKQEKEIIDKEATGILKHIKPDVYVIALCIEGTMLDSEAISATLSKLALQGSSNIVFIIGGSLGLSEHIKKRADLNLSFSKLTFPHQLMRIILLEQIYRSFRIMHGEPYHK